MILLISFCFGLVDIDGLKVFLPPGVGVDIVVVNVISVDVVTPPGVGGATADGK